MLTRPPALIVEDEILVALDLERILDAAGYDVVGIAADRLEAMAYADRCEIAFVDVNLRDGASGPGIGSSLAQDYGVKVVFVTANPGQLGDSAHDAACYVSKPFGAQAIQLAARVAHDNLTELPDDGHPVILLGPAANG